MVTISISAEALAAIASTLPDKVALRGIIGNPTSIRLIPRLGPGGAAVLLSGPPLTVAPLRGSLRWR